MTKYCVSCDYKVGGLLFGRGYEKCEDCSEYVCNKCYTKEGDGYYCKGCHRKKLGSGGCFIATACYGIDSSQVEILRGWRDNTLLKSSFGNRFVDFYYNISPPIADFIKDKPLLKKIVCCGLNPIVSTLRGYS